MPVVVWWCGLQEVRIRVDQPAGFRMCRRWLPALLRASRHFGAEGGVTGRSEVLGEREREGGS
ncbi:hypothetical protein B0T18DRAFT_398172 [Schizothecium vesticola]|uniref:Uncharacterized protein n=1 Tax=Schizothecium vesticola TaxID=314040 RepID=A0AA40KCQ0_9PEZI|nr:hypothetical protein B0T18DRAFT_398172 [Schizothecium vesticola]